MPAPATTEARSSATSPHSAHHPPKQLTRATTEADGSSRLDNVALTFGSNLRSKHRWDNGPRLIAGGAGFNPVWKRVMEDPKSPLCNLWLSTLRGAGVKANAFGDATGVIHELFEA